MKRKNLRIPCESKQEDVKGKNYRPHGTPVRSLLSPESMRALGRAHDLGIVK